MKNEKSWVLFLSFFCFLTNLTQLPVFVDYGITQGLAQLIWIVLLIICFIHKKVIISKQQILFMIGAIFFGLYCTIISVITQNDYFGTRIFYSFYLSLFIFFLGSFSGKNLNEEDFRTISIGYVFGVIILSVNIFQTAFLGNMSSLLSTSYAYSSKNSVSLILLTGLILLIYVINTKSMIKNITRYLFVLWLIFMLLILRSRATILSLFFLIIDIIRKRNSKNLLFLRVMILVIVVTTIGLLLTNERFYNIFVNGILFGGRESDNINDLTSNRFYEWSAFPELFNKYFLVGAGKYKMESLPLSVLIQYGIAGVYIIIVALWPFFWSLNKNKQCYSSNIVYALLIISFTYCINGIFEELAPFGPGVKCYFLWFLFGMLYSNRTILSDNKIERRD